MSTTPHPRAQLSAYLDGALSPVERTAVDAHLDACGDCRARLAELRGTASLIRALPDLVPSRSLLPRREAVPFWLAPLRTLSTMASGAAAFLFVASILLGNVSLLSTSTGAQPAAAPAAGGAATAENSTAFRSSATTAPPAAALDATKVASPTPAAQGAGAAPGAATASPREEVSRPAADSAQRDLARETPIPQIGTPPMWLALALLFAAIAIALQRRLRSVR